MNKLDMESKDIVNENIEKISKLFPNVIVESENGKSIDFDLLKQELSKEIIEGNKEKYQLTWPGKKEAIVNANTPCNKTLRPVKEKSIDFDNTQNIYIEGDNLEALKILQESYLGKIKCIYIDPPYNTGNDFIYNDNFDKNINQELKESGQVDDYNKKLITNTESHGRYHSDWLTMMYARLKLARNLLKDDGIILISIDEYEFVNLKKVCDEIFGETNYIENFIWRKNSTKNNSLTTSTNHEYIMCYAKNIEKIKNDSKIFRVKKVGYDEVLSFVENCKKAGISCLETETKLRNLLNSKEEWKGISAYKFVDEFYNVYTSDNTSAPTKGDFYDVIHPKTNKPCKIPSTGWRYKKETMEKLISENHILFGEDESNVPRYKRFLKDMETDIVKSTIDDNTDGKKEIMRLFEGNSLFENPKPTTLIKYLINVVNEDDFIVLDFFAGSATTADSILQINAEQCKNIKYILVQLPEKCEENTEAYKNGYNTICDISEERIRRASKIIKEETNANIDYGFRNYKVDSSNMKDVYYTPNEIKQSQLGIFESNIKEDRNAEDLLTQVILDLGLTLDLKIEEKNILNNKVYFVDENSLIACFDNEIDINVVDEICKYNPLKVVFKDESFKFDNDKINLQERFKKLSPNTEISIL